LKVPKIKTRRGAAKRFKVTGRGKIVRGRANHNHILTKKSSKRKRRLRQDCQVDAADHERVRKQIPYL
jgi:large subunit ribosomal protein L35